MAPKPFCGKIASQYPIAPPLFNPAWLTISNMADNPNIKKELPKIPEAQIVLSLEEKNIRPKIRKIKLGHCQIFKLYLRHSRKGFNFANKHISSKYPIIIKIKIFSNSISHLIKFSI